MSYFELSWTNVCVVAAALGAWSIRCAWLKLCFVLERDNLLGGVQKIMDGLGQLKPCEATDDMRQHAAQLVVDVSNATNCRELAAAKAKSMPGIQHAWLELNKAPKQPAAEEAKKND